MEYHSEKNFGLLVEIKDHEMKFLDIDATDTALRSRIDELTVHAYGDDYQSDVDSDNGLDDEHYRWAQDTAWCALQDEGYDNYLVWDSEPITAGDARRVLRNAEDRGALAVQLTNNDDAEIDDDGDLWDGSAWADDKRLYEYGVRVAGE